MNHGIIHLQCLERDGRSPSVLDVVPVLNYVTSDDIVFWFSVIIGEEEEVIMVIPVRQ